MTATGHALRGHGEPVTAHRVRFWAPVASFRDPLFPGMAHGLPLPPPSTVRGLLAAATGEREETLPFGMAAWAEGGGVDAETYHPIAADGRNPAVAGRVRAVKGGMTIKDRPFLAHLHLTLWLPGAEGERVAAALRRPRWPLRLGRSQDVVHLEESTRTVLEPAEEAAVDHALAPAGGHTIPFATVHRLATYISLDRLTTRWDDYLWCGAPTGKGPVRNAWTDDQEQAVWLLTV
ncbi:hypothetical protein GCM10009549_26190 [Streptomyces thermoalcalitolerans]|uniref:CRISPR-associated protein Cas5 n=1 Tax=Streptomyces thermoalcalitolerans TaxID=65605 RepID=A0ABN1NNJ4_9ACTN